MQLGRRLSEGPLHFLLDPNDRVDKVQSSDKVHIEPQNHRQLFYSSMAQLRAGDMLTWSQILVLSIVRALCLWGSRPTTQTLTLRNDLDRIEIR